MKLLQRQLFYEFVKVFFLALTVLLLFILMGRALQLRDMLFGLDVSFADTLRLFMYMSPLFLLMLCPVACMLAIFLTFLRMGTDRELVALRAGGVSLYQMLPASLGFALLCTLFALAMSLWGQGWGMANFRSEILDIAGSRARVVVRPGVFNKDIPNMVFYARRADIASGTLSQILVVDRGSSNDLTILAPEGNVGTDYNRGELALLLKDGVIYTTRNNLQTVLSFEEYVVRISLDTLFTGLDLGPIKPRDMSWKELSLLDADRISEDNPRLFNKILVERQKRWVFPAACVILCIFAIPIASSFQGMQQQSGLVLALVLFLVYYSLLSLGISMGEAGNLPVLPALWGPNILFLILGINGFFLAANERMPRIPFLFRAFRRRSRLSEPAGGDSSGGERA